MKKLFGCSQLFILQTRKISYLNTLYFRLHKNDKRVDLSIYIFNLHMFIDFFYFYVAQNIK
jgi:hypothetical protein